MELTSHDKIKIDSTSKARRLSAEQLIWLTLIMMAAVLRFGRLGQSSLSPAEAAEAWRVWLFWSPDGTVFLDAFSPAYFTLTSLLTQIFGFSDGVMRLVPAAAGLAAVVAVYRLRPLLGNLGALIAAFWLAVSPILVYQSRLAGGDSLAMLAVILFAGSVWQLHAGQPDNPTRQLQIAAGAAAVGFAASPIFITGMIPLILAVVWFQRSTRSPEPAKDLEEIDGDLEDIDAAEEAAAVEEIQSSGAIHALDPANRRLIMQTAAITFLIASTMFFWHLPGLGQTADIFASWFGAFRQGFSLSGWERFLITAGRYEFLPLISALTVAVWTLFRRSNKGQALTLWFGLALLLAGLQNSESGMLSMVVLPTAVLLGFAAEQLREVISPYGDSYWIGTVQVASLLVLLLLIVSANLGRYARISVFDPTDVAHLLLALLCALVTIFVWLLVVVWDTPLGIASGMITVLLAGLVVQWGTAWRIGVTAVNNPHEPIMVSSTDDELSLLIDATVNTAREVRGTERAVSLFSALDHPLLRWYLRDFDRAEFGSAVPVQATFDLIIAPDEADPSFGTEYLGTDFGFLICECYSPAGWLENMRWFFFTEGPPPVDEQRLVLWLRSDLLINE
ncbi:MAG: glycosyltransferase family 39 protein [Ardenticatenaceae bacterium]|nr:glycosyltransferase family 39 protein [Ardenticatenaceae bacterium]